MLVPFAVTFADDRWFADVGIDLGPDAGYSPMVQLALVRSQRLSEPGMERSGVLRTDIVDLLPDRTLTAARARPTSR